MPQATDSRFKGFLQPAVSPSQPQDDPLIDFFQPLVVGILNITPSLIRPKFQTEPPALPGINVNWVAITVNAQSGQLYPAVVHDPTGDGSDVLQNHEVIDAGFTFYGPNSGGNASKFRDGLNIEQNRAELRAAGVGVLDIGQIICAPELLLNNRWYNRADMTVSFNREIKRRYPVLNILSAKGDIRSQTDVISPFNTESEI